MRLVIDTRQQADKHNIKDKWFEEHGIETVRKKVDFGDYILDVEHPTVSVDTKRSVDEIAQNISSQHERFKREILRANDNGARLVILVENKDGYLIVDDLLPWVNSECKRCRSYFKKECNPCGPGPCTNSKHKSKHKPIQGARLALAMKTMSTRYGVEWLFCRPEDSAQIIYSILKEADGGKEHN